MSNTISTQICRKNVFHAPFVKQMPATHNSWFRCLEWITDRKKKGKTRSPEPFFTVSGYQGNVLLVAGTSDVFLYMSRSLISFDGINDRLVHRRREMEENQN